MLKFPIVSLRNSIFIRMVIIYLVVVIPIILLSIYLYTWSYKNASDGISRAVESQLVSYLEDMHREIEWLELKMFDMMEDGEIHRSAVTWTLMSEVEKKNSLNYVLHRLSSIKSSSTLIEDVYAHMRSVGKSASALKGIYEFDKPKFEYLSWNFRYNNDRFIMQEDVLQMVAVKQSGKKGEPPLYIVEIELDSTELRSTLDRVNIYPGSGSFLISETLNYALTSGDDGAELLHDARLAGDSDASPMLVDVNGRPYQMNHAYSEDLQMYVVSYLPEEEFKRPLSRFQQWAWLYACVTLLAVVIYSYISYKKIHKPLLLLVRSFRKMEGGVLDIHIDRNQRDEFGFLYDRFNQMTGRLQNLIEQDFKHQMMMQKAELKQLQSQINPHFLYNSFFILHSMAKVGDVERIEEFTLMIGEYFRFITRNGEDFVRLEEETRHSRMYTEIQKLRFSRRIKVQFGELPDDLRGVKVPKLIFQPIIENAYEHCLERIDEGFLSVAFQRDHNFLRIIVENSGDITDAEIDVMRQRLHHPSETDEMTGMMNIHRRLILAFGEESGLQLSRSELDGLKVIIIIKLAEGRVDTDV